MELTKENLDFFLKSHDFPFQPNQNKLCYPKLERIFKRMMQGKKFPLIKICNGKIVEGHHRYVCSEFLKIEIEIIRGGANMSYQNNYLWSGIIVEEVDWDNEKELKFYEKMFDL